MGNYKTCGDEPIQPTTVVDLEKGSHQNGESTAHFYGLTKREHMAIEFTKAYANSDFVSNSGVPFSEIAE